MESGRRKTNDRLRLRGRKEHVARSGDQSSVSNRTDLIQSEIDWIPTCMGSYNIVDIHNRFIRNTKCRNIKKRLFSLSPIYIH